jgi:hypothetical protein
VQERKFNDAVKGWILTHAPNGNNSLSPSKRGEGWLVAPKPGEGGGAGFELVNIGLLTPALSFPQSGRRRGRKNGVCQDVTREG